MSRQENLVAADRLDNLIYELRGQKVMLDGDLARVYGVSTKRLNEQVKRNRDRFPEDFVFQLTQAEVVALRRLWSLSATSKDQPPGATQVAQDAILKGNRSQIATGSQKHRDPRSRPYAFTEHGAIMAANVLNSPRAVQMSVFVVRAFIKMRGLLTDTRGLARKLAALESELKQRLDVQEAAIVTILQRVMDIIDPPAEPESPPKPIGFGVKERQGRYRIRSYEPVS